MSRSPDATKAWVKTLSSWDFERVVPAHFDAPLAVRPKEFAAAFDFLSSGTNDVRFCAEDVQFLNDAIDEINKGPPDLAIYPTTLGPLKGKQCNLLS